MSPRVVITCLTAGLWAAASAAGAERSQGEAAMDAALRASFAVPAPAPGDARAAAAAVTAWLVLGRDEEALRALRGIDGLEGDCVLAARRAQLMGGVPCTDVPVAALEAEATSAPVAGSLVVADAGEDRLGLFNAALAAALAAAGPPDAVLATADRFRVDGRVSIEGALYLDDGMLLVARGGTPSAVRAALDDCLVLLGPRGRPSTVSPARPSAPRTRMPRAEHAGAQVPADAREHVDPRGRFRIVAPEGWTASETTEGGWRLVRFAPAGSTEPCDTSLTILERTAEPGEARRSVIARRKPSDATPLPAAPRDCATSDVLRPGSGREIVLRATSPLAWQPALDDAIASFELRSD